MDEDILSQGDARPPGPWPRRLGVIAAVAAVAIGGVVYLGRPHGQPAASATPPTPATLSPEPVASPEFARLSVGPNGVIGPPAAWEVSLRVPVSSTQPAWFWPATGRSETIGGLPAHDSGYQFTRVGGGWAVQADETFCGGGDCAVPPGPVWFLGNGAQSAIPVGTADLIAPPRAPTPCGSPATFRPPATPPRPAWRGRSAPPALSSRHRSVFRLAPSSTRQPSEACC